MIVEMLLLALAGSLLAWVMLMDSTGSPQG